jgi:hypothetical protein
MPALTPRALNRATLARQLLLRRERLDAVAAIERLAGMQAQVPKPPFVGLWTRLEDFDAAALRNALQRGDAVRATLMRGTLHLVSKHDFEAWRPLIQPVLSAGAATVTRSAPAMDVEAIVKVATKFMKQPHTFEELRQHLVEHFPGDNDRFLGYLARMHVPLTMVPDDSPWSFPPDARFTLAKTSKSGSLEDLVTRYLAAFGPATPADFQTWSGLKNAKPVFEKLDLVRFGAYFDLPDAPRPEEDVDAPVRFLPEFDNLLLAWSDRTRIVSEEHRPRIITKNLRIPATFLVDGTVAGIWKIEKKKLVLDPFLKLTKNVRAALEAEGDSLVRFASA